jgi:superfamily II DNA or RNA helicase
MIELAQHQTEALGRITALLERFGGAILADEAGLGKSYVAAAIAAGHRGEVEAIVPASLVAQWRETLEDFGAAARVLTHDSLLNERFVPQIDRRRLLIVDEAHAFRNPATQRYDALARRSVGASLLLVTATPICNSPDDLAALVNLIAADDGLRPAGVASIERAFRDRDESAIRRVIAELVVRRGRDVLPDALRFGAIERRVVRHRVPVLDIDALRFPLSGAHRELQRSVLWRRLESSEAALIESVRRQTRFYERALACRRSGRTLTRREYRRAFGSEDEGDALQEVLFWDVFAPEGAEADPQSVREEVRRLDCIRDAAAAAPKEKLERLAAICREASDPVLIFTSAIATANEIANALRAGVLTSRDARPADALDAFRRGRINVLVCTDLASEGLNLQRAGVVVHYDIPWNPVKLEQRNGRAWRIGQTRPSVQAIYFIPDSRRTGIVETVAAKNRSRRRLLLAASGMPEPRSLVALPPHLPRDAPAVALDRALRAAKLPASPEIARRHRAGVERLFAQMAREFLDERRLRDLLALIGTEPRRPV